MRKLIALGLMAATILPAMPAAAQSRAEIRRDRQEVREERQELRHARRVGDRRDVREERRELRDARRELREDRRDRRDVRRHARYVAPYRGWTYRPVRIGFQLQPHFFSSRYLIAHPGHYRLAHPGFSRRWIRYGDDLLLVNVRNGRVIQVVPNYFW